MSQSWWRDRQRIFVPFNWCRSHLPTQNYIVLLVCPRMLRNISMSNASCRAYERTISQNMSSFRAIFGIMLHHQPRIRHKRQVSRSRLFGPHTICTQIMESLSKFTLGVTCRFWQWKLYLWISAQASSLVVYSAALIDSDLPVVCYTCLLESTPYWWLVHGSMVSTLHGRVGTWKVTCFEIQIPGV